MAEHDCLGCSCGPGREEECRNVRAHRLLDRLRANVRKIQYIGVLMSALLKADLEGVLAVGTYCVEPVRIKENALDLDEIHQMLYLGVCKRSVNRDHNGAHVHNTHVCDGPLRTVLSRDSHPVALPDAL